MPATDFLSNPSADSTPLIGSGLMNVTNAGSRETAMTGPPAIGSGKRRIHISKGVRVHVGFIVKGKLQYVSRLFEL